MPQAVMLMPHSGRIRIGAAAAVRGIAMACETILIPNVTFIEFDAVSFQYRS